MIKGIVEGMIGDHATGSAHIPGIDQGTGGVGVKYQHLERLMLQRLRADQALDVQA